jgi:hypothetical protein
VADNRNGGAGRVRALSNPVAAMLRHAGDTGEPSRCECRCRLIRRHAAVAPATTMTAALAAVTAAVTVCVRHLRFPFNKDLVQVQ